MNIGKLSVIGVSVALLSGCVSYQCPAHSIKPATLTPLKVIHKKTVVKSLKIEYPEHVLFAINKANITPTYRSFLHDVIRDINEDCSGSVQVDGHTSSTGSARYNMALSIRRAKSIQRYLTQHGVKSSRIKVRGFGLQFPVACNFTEWGRRLNRRVEIRIHNCVE